MSEDKVCYYNVYSIEVFMSHISPCNPNFNTYAFAKDFLFPVN